MTKVIDPASTAAARLEVAEAAQLLVIGAGAAGLAAAIAGARRGLSVVLVDENPVPAATMGDDVPQHFGQRMTGAARNAGAMLEAFVASDPAIAEAFDAGVDVRLGVTCFGLYANGASVAWLPGSVAGLTDGTRSWMLGFGAVIVASGRRDSGLAFPGWELPGVMGVTAARLLALRYGALATRRAVVLGTTAEAMEAAAALRQAGVDIAAIVEPAAIPLSEDAAVLCGHCVQRAEGDADGVTAIVVAAVDAEGRPLPGTERRIACDTILLGIGAVPVIELLDALGCATQFDPARGGHVPVLGDGLQTSIPGVFVAGDCCGIWAAKTWDRGVAEAEGRHAAAQAALFLGLDGAVAAPASAPVATQDVSAYRLAWVRAAVIGTGGTAIVCQCEDVSARDILDVRPPRYLGWDRPPRNAPDLAALLGNGPPSPDQVKRLTRAGMGLCQGRRCREQVAALLALGTGGTLADVPLASHRAPVRPLPLRAARLAATAEVEKHWDVWFGIPSQVVPYWEIGAGTEERLGFHPKPRQGPGGPWNPTPECETSALRSRVPRASRPLAGFGVEPQPFFRPGASVIIVGAGATGLSAGWWLAQAGVDVLVLDKGIVGWEASGRNGGGCTHGFSPLFAEEQRLWPQMEALLGYPTEFRPGRIRIALHEEQLRFANRMEVGGNRCGFRTDRLDAQQTRALVPLVGDNVLGAHYHHFGGHANPHRTVQGYAWAMQDHGGRLLQHTTVTGFRETGGRVTAVLTDRGEFGCDALVLAAGPQTGRLAAMLGVSVPMVPARAEMIVTEPLPLMPIGGVDGNGLYGRQTLRGNLAYGGGPHEWVDLPEDAADMRPPPRVSTPLMGHIAAHLADLFPKAAHARILRSWAGIIENTPDGRPVIERLAEPSNVVVTTLSSIGFGLSPASGHAIQQLVTDGACDFADLSSFSLARFDGLAADWAARQGWAA